MLRDKLLNTIAEDNEYLDKLIELVKLNESYPKKKEKGIGREIHHIIPRFYYKMERLELDNSDSNLVSLTKGQHFLIHYYTYMCAKQRYKCKAAAPVYIIFNLHKKDILKEFMLNSENCKYIADIIDSTADDRHKFFVENGKHCRDDWTDEQRKAHSEKISAQLRGRKMSPEFCEKIRVASIGRKISEETKLKISNAQKGQPGHNKGKHWKIKDTSKMGHPNWAKEKGIKYHIEDTENYKISNKKNVAKAKAEYEEYKANGGTLKWNSWRKARAKSLRK